MSINFPSSPVNGQVYSYSGISWQWNTIYWEAYSAQSAYISSLVSVGTGSPVIYDVSGGTGFFYSLNGVGGVSVFTSGQTLYISGSSSGGSSGGLTYYVQTSIPTGTTSGDRWFDTNTGVELVWINDGNSSQWVQPFSVPGPANALSYYLTTGITTSQTITWDKNYWGISASTNVNLTLPNTASKDGYFLTIKDESGNCGTYRIRLIPSVGLIDGNNYVDMNINFMSLTCIVRGGNWYLI